MSIEHHIPPSIEKETCFALSHYPLLENTSILFKFKRKIKRSTMQARPRLRDFFKPRKKRKYVILISEQFRISEKKFYTRDLPSEVLIGWIAHELGHIMDYRNRSSLNLLLFGFKYIFWGHYIKEAERAADSFAVAHGLEKYILKTKNFILNHSDLPVRYVNRIRKYYLSPEEIMVLVAERDAVAT